MKKINYTGDSKIITRIVQLLNKKAPLPESNNSTDWGTDGQVLATDGSGSTFWKTAIDNTVNNLVNYYLKTETYTQAEVNALISSVTSINFEVVTVLPTTDISQSTIYLVPKTTAQTDNVYDEYINTDGTTASWELIGDTQIDLSNYYTKTESDNLLNSKVDKVSGKGLSTEDFTSALKSKLEGIAAGAEVNVQSDWNQTDTSADDYIKNKPTIPTVNNGQLSLKLNDATVGSFTANQSGNVEYNLLPTELRNMFKPEGGSGDRPTSANITPNNNASVQHFLATGTMTTGAPPSNGSVLHFSWDSNNRYAKQLAILNSSAAGLATRYQTGTGQNDWSEWVRYYPDGYQWNTYSTTAITATAEEHADLNDFKTAGNYSSVDSSVSQYIDNAPTTSTGFNLIVMRITNSSSRIRQIAFANASTAIYTRYYSSSTWSSWVNIATTYSALTASALKTGTATTLRTVRADYLNDGIKQIAQERVESSNTAIDVGKSSGYGIAGNIPVYESFLTKTQTYQYNTDSAMQEQYYVKMPFTSEYGSNRFIIYEADFWLGALTSATRYKMEPENISMSMSSGDDEAVITVNFKAINKGTISGALAGHIKFSEYID